MKITLIPSCAHLDKARKTAKAPCQVNNAVRTLPSEHEEDVNDGQLDDLELQVYAARRQSEICSLIF